MLQQKLNKADARAPRPSQIAAPALVSLCHGSCPMRTNRLAPCFISMPPLLTRQSTRGSLGADVIAHLTTPTETLRSLCMNYRRAGHARPPCIAWPAVSRPTPRGKGCHGGR